MSKKQPIKDLLASDSVPQSLKDRLYYAQQAKEFAHSELMLPNNGSYSDYVQLEENYVSWVVFVADPFQMQLREWCFWLLGCVPYRGYFDVRDANQFARYWQSRHYDTYVVGVPAYSTLGWFADPIVSSMMANDNLSTAAVIFHELAHQKIYVKNDTEFNESFAEAVKWIGLEKWVQLRNEPEMLKDYAGREEMIAELTELMSAYREKLSESFSNRQRDLLAVTKTKAQIYAQLNMEIEQLKRKWFDLYEFKVSSSLSGLNNAGLLAFESYHGYKRQLIDMYRLSCHEDLNCFYDTIGRLAKLPAWKRKEVIKSAGYDELETGIAAQ